MTRLAVLGVLLMVVGVLVSPSLGQMLATKTVQPADDPFLITPGVGIGKVKIGMPIAAVISILGAPKDICRGRGEGGNTDVYAWFEMRCTPAPKQPTGASPSNSGGGLVVYTDPAGTVTSVVAYKDARYFLENGLHVGSAESLIRARMGGDPVISIGFGSEGVQYPALGISFLVEGVNVITSIGVSKPGTR